MTTTTNQEHWVSLPLPPGLTKSSRRGFYTLLRRLQKARFELQDNLTLGVGARRHDPVLAAATGVILDLVRQGWGLRYHRGRVDVCRPDELDDPESEKSRVRRQELLRRDEQLSKDSVRRFVERMERPTTTESGPVSISNLMRDGPGLARELGAARGNAEKGPAGLRAVVDPYLQVISGDERCAHTGLRLMDIWRYFRHTWTNAYSSSPGRNMPFLVRDRAVKFHPVIGIGALASAVVQIGERDEWIGWHPDTFLRELDRKPSLEAARWLANRLVLSRDELYLDDLLEDGLYWDALWDEPSADAIERLTKEADTRRHDHYRDPPESMLKITPSMDSEWMLRARTDLFRSKRCAALADLLRARQSLLPYLTPPSRNGLVNALRNASARQAIRSIVRRAKASTVGTEIADLVVCGAVPPYNALLGGKLTCMLAVSPTVVRAYRKRYEGTPSHIASSLAGRPILRSARLAFIGTTSLYGSKSSQYNRVRIPADRLGGRTDESLYFNRLGRSKSFGTSHLSAGSIAALAQLSSAVRSERRVNHIFGEGGNAKLRTVRDGLQLLGWPADYLLQHRRERILYGVPLIRNAMPYLLRMQHRPQYLADPSNHDDVRAITDWWIERWLSKRILSDDVLAAVRHHETGTESHGARVTLPDPIG